MNYICISINIPDLSHWILVVINIKSFCTNVYNSLFEVGCRHFAVVNHMMRKLAEIISLFFISTSFYGKRNDINWEKKLKFMDQVLGDPLVYFIADDIFQQCEDSNLKKFHQYSFFSGLFVVLVMLHNCVYFFHLIF